jgi:hypothetical protein
MGFHKRYITNSQVIEIYNNNGIQQVYDLYVKSSSATITETGIASNIEILIKTFVNSIDKLKEPRIIREANTELLNEMSILLTSEISYKKHLYNKYGNN